MIAQDFLVTSVTILWRTNWAEKIWFVGIFPEKMIFQKWFSKSENEVDSRKWKLSSANNHQEQTLNWWSASSIHFSKGAANLNMAGWKRSRVLQKCIVKLRALISFQSWKKTSLRHTWVLWRLWQHLGFSLTFSFCWTWANKKKNWRIQNVPTTTSRASIITLPKNPERKSLKNLLWQIDFLFNRLIKKTGM